uniref:Uncharacterized protein n=2 Tax=Trichuris muris TaxID=70415 RepID=A0A5S6Q1A2_TRIMR
MDLLLLGLLVIPSTWSASIFESNAEKIKRKQDAEELKKILNLTELTSSERTDLIVAYKSFAENVSDCFVANCFSIINHTTTTKHYMPIKEYMKMSTECQQCMEKCQKQFTDILLSVEWLLAISTHHFILNEFEGLGEPGHALAYWRKYENDPLKVTSERLERDFRIARRAACT